MQRPIAFVIEDQANLVMLYEDALRLVGYDVIAIRDGLQALNQLEINEPPVFIILDINLPGLSGRDIHQYIRKNARYDKTPVMILTANSVMANTIRPEMTKNDQLFIKPISMRALQDFAKLMRPGKDGVPTHLADTQKIPHLPILDAEEDDTLENIVEILTPDDSLTVDMQPKSEEKLESQEHQAIIAPNDDNEEKTDAVSDKAKETKIDEKAPAEKTEAEANSEVENK